MKYFNKFETESKRLLINPMQTLAFGFICQDEEIVGGGQKNTHSNFSFMEAGGQHSGTPADGEVPDFDPSLPKEDLVVRAEGGVCLG